MSFVAGVGAAPCRVQCYNDINDNKEGHQHPYNRPVHLLCVSFCSGREEDRDRKKKRLEGRGGTTKTHEGQFLPEGMPACGADRTSLS